MPGRTDKYAYFARPYLSSSSFGTGRGPTKLMSPASTLKICGSSSSEVLRRTRPNRVTRGSLRSFTSRSHSARAAGSWASIAGRPKSASGTIVRSFRQSNITPRRPTRAWLKNPVPCLPADTRIIAHKTMMIGRTSGKSNIARSRSKARLGSTPPRRFFRVSSRSNHALRRVRLRRKITWHLHAPTNLSPQQR